MKTLLFLLIAPILSLTCELNSNANLVDINVQIGGGLVKVKKEGYLLAEELQCDKKEFKIIDFFLDNERRQHLFVNELKENWVDVLDKKILVFKKPFGFLRKLITDAPLLKATFHSVQQFTQKTKYHLGLALINDVRSSNKNPLYRNLLIESFYFYPTKEFKNFLVIDDSKSEFDNLTLILSVSPIKIKELKFYKNKKLVKSIDPEKLKASQL